MRIRVPSFQLQIILLVVLLILTSVLFFRDYFIKSFQTFTDTTKTLSINDKSRQLFEDYRSNFDSDTQEEFRKDIEEIMSTENQEEIARHVFIDEVKLYSKFILFFLTLFVIVLFFVSFNFITRPLKRLQDATVKLAKGDLAVRVKESRFSPLNDLIVSFNNMSEELQNNRRKLVQAEKDSAWRDMARVLAHEIKNPLTPMRLSLERLEMKYAMKSDNLDEIFTNVTKVIHEEIDKLQSFSTEFSNFAKLPLATMEYYNINPQISEICEPYKNEININLRLGNDIPLVLADKVQMKQVLDNLIQNSINATKDILVIDIYTYSNVSNIIIEVSDTGKGIDEQYQKEVFKPYFTKSQGGTGLGLAIVKRIIENHNGQITVESKVDIGTKFTISLPIVNPQEN